MEIHVSQPRNTVFFPSFFATPFRAFLASRRFLLTLGPHSDGPGSDVENWSRIPEFGSRAHPIDGHHAHIYPICQTLEPVISICYIKCNDIGNIFYKITDLLVPLQAYRPHIHYSTTTQLYMFRMICSRVLLACFLPIQALGAPQLTLSTEYHTGHVAFATQAPSSSITMAPLTAVTNVTSTVATPASSAISSGAVYLANFNIGPLYAGQIFNIAWAGSGAPVNITLANGPTDNLQQVTTVTSEDCLLCDYNCMIADHSS